MSSVFEPGGAGPVDYPLAATRQTITPEAVARGAAALDQAFPALGQDFTPAWFVKAAALVLEAALGMPAPPNVGMIGESAGGYGYGPVPPSAPSADMWPEQAPLEPLETGGAVRLEFADGRPLWVNPAYVACVAEPHPTDLLRVDRSTYEGELAAVQLAGDTGWLVRGNAEDVTTAIWAGRL